MLNPMKFVAEIRDSRCPLLPPAEGRRESRRRSANRARSDKL